MRFPFPMFAHFLGGSLLSTKCSMKCPEEHFMSHLRPLALSKDDSLVNTVWNIMVDLWHKHPPFFGCETMSMGKGWMDMAIHEAHTINYIGHRLAPIESVIFRGVEFHLRSKFLLELSSMES